MTNRWRWFGLRTEPCFVVLLLIGFHVEAGETRVDPSEKLRQLGGMTIDIPRKRVTLCGWVNQTEGPIEYVVCAPYGKTHESIFISREPPENLQAAILLLGVKPGTSPSDQGRGQPAGPSFEIWVKWSDCAETKQVRVEAMMYNHRVNSVLPDTTWIFTGSKVEDGMFKANVYGSYAVVYWDPWAIFNINHDVGKDDDALSVHAESVPPKGTSVKLEFRYVGEAE